MPPSRTDDKKHHPPLAALLLPGLVVVIIIALFFADPFLNRIVQEKLGENDTSGSGPVKYIGRLHLSPWTLTLECDTLAIQDPDQSYRITTGLVSVSGLRWYRFAFGSGIEADDITIHAPRLFLSPTNADTVKREVASPRAELPSVIRPFKVHRLSVVNGSSHFGSRSSLTALSCVLYDVAFEQIPVTLQDWLHAIDGVALTIDRANIRDTESGYHYTVSGLSCNSDEGWFHIDSLALRPILPDSTFFAAEKKRTSRFMVSTGAIHLAGFRLGEARSDDAFHARSLLLDGVSWSILLDKRKPGDPKARPRMPNEILSRLKTSIDLDSIKIRRSLVTYGELFSHSPTPALLHWSDIEGTITDIRNHPARSEDTTVTNIAVSGSLMDRAKMSLALRMPLWQETFSLSCSGSAGPMSLDTLNPWLEVSDRTRITEGKMNKADFSFRVVGGKASGTTLPLYSGLTIATLDKKTGSSKGAVQAVKSLLANALKIVNDNPPEPGAPPKEGKISYVRQPTDPFFGYLWYSLRTGLGSVVGF